EEIAASDARVKLAIALSNERKARGLTQKKLSEMSGIKQPVISRLEHGDTSTQIDSLIKLATAMNMEMQFVSLDT
ncbi:MAG: helix-turn-helix transcriptional regulator, partial [Selenomonadaceae bacterium]|nr:helix-turn-helix transcriptional regulator [Selenomonadaceae bacterium]